MMKVITIDPGKTTGFCAAYIEEPYKTHLTVFQAAWNCADLFDYLTTEKPDVIVYEDFTYRPGMLPGLTLYSRNLIGVVQLYLELPLRDNAFRQFRHAWPVPLVYSQNPSILGGFYKDDNKLRQLGVYAKGLEHGRSATKHFLYWHNFKQGFPYNNKLGYEMRAVK